MSAIGWKRLALLALCWVTAGVLFSVVTILITRPLAGGTAFLLGIGLAMAVIGSFVHCVGAVFLSRRGLPYVWMAGPILAGVFVLMLLIGFTGIFNFT